MAIWMHWPMSVLRVAHPRVGERAPIKAFWSDMPKIASMTIPAYWRRYVPGTMIEWRRFNLEAQLYGGALVPENGRIPVPKDQVLESMPTPT